MSQRLPLQAAIQVTEYVLYMAAFAVAEKEANKLGFTLREWSEEDALRTKEAFDAGMEAKRDQREAAQAGPTEADMQNVIDMLNRVNNLQFPVASMHRVQKYIAKGYKAEDWQEFWTDILTRSRNIELTDENLALYID